MRSFGSLARFSIGLRTLVGTVFAVGAAVLAIGLTEETYARWDLSASGRNTLDDTILEVIDNLPEPVVVDVFFRPFQSPYDRVGYEAVGRLMDVLSVAERSRRNQITVKLHDVADIEGAQVRQRELGVEGVNLMVVSNESGTQKSVRNLYGDLAVIDWGQPTADGIQYLARQGIVVSSAAMMGVRPGSFRPARLSTFRGEEVFAESLLRVSSAESPRVYFATGQGEPSLDGPEPTDLSSLRTVLEQDGFEVEEWKPAEARSVPDDCVVLALVGAGQAYPPGTLEAVRAYVARGGRVVGAPTLREVELADSGGIVELLRGYGMISQPGIVCEPIVSLSGQEIWSAEECADVLVQESGLSASHPLTEPLRRRARHLRFFGSTSFRRGGLESGGVLLDLANSSTNSWLDQPLQPGVYDYTLDTRRERRERHRLVMLAELAADRTVAGEAVRKGRVLGVAGATFFSNALIQDNRDFLLNAFNWMAERDYRLRVSPLPRGESRLDLSRGNALPLISWSLYLGLPGLCVAIGLVLAWRRRS